MGAAPTIIADADQIEELLDLGAEVLGLGEPTHGSANVLDWKVGLVLELARRGRRIVLALEESVPVARATDAVLRGACGADPFDAWSAGSRLWRTEGYREGLRAIACWNGARSPADRIALIGVDIQHPGRAAADLLAAGVRAEVLERIAQGGGAGARGGVHSADIPALAALVSRLEREGRAEALLHARVLHRHALAYVAEPDLAGLWRRDGFMAQTLLEQRGGTGAGDGAVAEAGAITILSAHNEHIACSETGFGGPTMGWALRQELGERFVSIGVLCGDGECRAIDPSSGSREYRSLALPPLREGSTDEQLARRGEVLVRAREVPHPGPRRFIGWMLDSRDAEAQPEAYEVRRPISDFDLLKHFPRSEADRSA